MPTNVLCSYCYTAQLKMMQASPYLVYNKYYKEQLEYAQSRCGFTGPTDILGGLTLAKADDSLLCACNQTYVTKDGDTCDGIVAQYSVASASIFTGNSEVIANCFELPVGADLCVPLSCSPLYIL